MRIAILSNAFPPDGRGGAERIAALQADVLFERGHEVAVWAPGEKVESSTCGSNNSDACKILDSSIHRFPSLFTNLDSLNAFRRCSFHISDRGVNHHVAHEIYLWKPDVIMTHNLTGCGFGTASYLQSRGIRWIHTLHDVQLFEPSGQKRADRKSHFY
jgi:glycosyltransferase involved in cell wall biosynthesis